MCGRKLFVVNVGANASHGNAVSPLYDDGNFDLITIPEQRGVLSRECLRYSDLRWHFRGAVRLILGERKWTTVTHNDPDLWNGVYGDLPHSSPRAAALRRARPGDYLLFFARLRAFHANGFRGKAGFYFIGGWRIERILDIRENTQFPKSKGVPENPHVRKHLKGSRQRFSLFLAGTKPVRLAPPIRMDRPLLERILPESRMWNWTSGRSPLQTMGSYLRTVRAIDTRTHRGLTDLLRVGG